MIIQDAGPKMVDTPVTLISGGASDIVNIIFAHKGGQYFDCC